MAPMKDPSSNNFSSSHGEPAAQQANVLASCYIVDPSASLKGLHYCTTGAAGLPSPPSSPPLAAFTSSNELALKPKAKKRSAAESHATSRNSRRGGATLQIREECERFFCETMKSLFQGERNMDTTGSVRSGVYYHNQQQRQHQPLTPPDDYPTPPASFSSDAGFDKYMTSASVVPRGWMEFWDYSGGASFRAFVTEDGDERTLFAFFDMGLIGRDLKPALIALIELADGPLECSHIVICMDRMISDSDAKTLMRSLQWVGFDFTTLDHWAKDVDVTSNRWLFLGMDL